MTTSVTPEIVSGPNPDYAWDEPCPNCHDRWDAGPEGSAWGRQHCWHCGYTPSSGNAVLASAPDAPDWAALMRSAVTEALTSQPQVLAEAMTAALGHEGMAALARQQQENLGFSQGTGS